MLAWTRAMAGKVVLTGHTPGILQVEPPRFAAGLGGHKKEKEVMSKGILDDGIPITEMGDCRKNMFVWENQEFRLGHVKCEMSINIQVEMLRRQMEA